MFGLSKEQRDELNEKFKKREKKLREQELSKEDKFRAVLSDRFDVTDDRAVKLAIGIEELGDDWEKAAEANHQELESAYGVDFESLKAILRNYEKTGRMDQLTGSNGDSDDLSHGFESYEGLIQEIESRGCEPSELTVVADPEGEIKRLVQELNEADISPDKVAVGRQSDIRDAKGEKETLRREISDEKGISPDELESLSLPSLRSLAGSDSPDSDLSPAPKSKYKKDGTVPRGREEEAAKLQEQKEFLEGRSGVLAEKRLEHIEEELNELKS